MSEDEQEKMSYSAVQNDDDIVIQAGAVKQSYPEDYAELKQSTEKSAAKKQGNKYSTDLLSEQQTTTSPHKTKPEYHETTQKDFDDLKPMPTMQKVIIALAVVGLAVCIVYYLVFIR